jgi:hypothetical protein
VRAHCSTPLSPGQGFERAVVPSILQGTCTCTLEIEARASEPLTQSSSNTKLGRACLGNDYSFQSFPLHVHRLLQRRLAGTHRVYSKIYPRYKTYRAFHVARDDFSEWLTLHESPSTDVVLVGHSMGGLLAADVVLMVSISNLLGHHDY